MPFINADRVKETTTTTGTGNITLAGAVLGFRAFYPTLSVGDTFKYFIVSTSGTEWESGLGTLTASSTLARTTVQSSSNANAAVNFSAGLKEVGIGPTAGGETPWNPVTNTLDISVNALNDVAITSPTVNQVLKYSGTEWTNQADAVNVGTVTSVSGAGTVSGLTLTGTVTSSGSLTLGGAISTLNQNTTGNAATVTTNANLTGHITSTGNAAVLGSFTSAQLAGALTDETGTGANVFATSPTLVTPFSNTLSAVPVASGAGNSLTIAAGSGVTSGAGANLILNPGEQATTGGRGTVLIDGLNVGKSKSSATNNTVFGAGALAAITTAYGNVAVGIGALALHTTTGQNVAVGQNTLARLISGSSNVAIGDHAVYASGSFTYNVGVGQSALQNVTGNNNIGIGGHAGEQGGAGAGSVYIGFLAGRNTAASDNVVIGNNAGFTGTYLTSGASNVIIGALTDMGTGNGAATNCIIIGKSAVGNGSNTTTIGNTSTTKTYLYGTISAIPVASGAGNSLTIAAGPGVGTGAGGSLILQAGIQATSGGDGKVIVKQVSGQTSNLQEWQNSAGTVLASVTAAGNVGIGSTAPARLLSVSSNTHSAASSIGLSCTTTGFGEQEIWVVGRTGGGRNDAAMVLYDNAVATVLIGANNGRAGDTYFNGGGNFGIGLTVPTARTHIVTAAATKGLIVQGAASQTANLTEWQNSAGTVLASVTAAGRVGIGTASPKALLNIEGVVGLTPPTLGTSGSQFFIGGDASLYGLYAGTVGTGPADGNSWFQVMRNDSATAYNLGIQPVGGSVGIGTMLPAARTHIVTVAATKGLIVQGAASQTANLQEWQDYAGTVLASVSAAGSIASNALAAIPVTVTSAGNALTVSAGNALITGVGGNLTLKAGTGAGSAGTGGDIILQPGAQGSGGGNGWVKFYDVTGANTRMGAWNNSTQGYGFGWDTQNNGTLGTGLVSSSVNGTGYIGVKSQLTNHFMIETNSGTTALLTNSANTQSRLIFVNGNNAQTTSGSAGICSYTTGVITIRDGGTSIAGGSLSFPSSTTAIAANTDNLVLTGSAFQRINCTSASNLTGIAPPTGGTHVDGRMIRVYNVGTANLTLVHNATSTAANRFFNSTLANIILAQHDYAELIYDITDNGSIGPGWRVA